MIKLNKNGLVDILPNITRQDLICLANIEKDNIDSKVLEIRDTDTIVVEGNYNVFNKYAVIGSDLVKILSSAVENKNTVLKINKGEFGVVGDIEKGNHCRSVVIVMSNKDIEPLSWEFTDTTGSVNSSLFPVELGSGTISMKSDLALWSPLSSKQKYKVRNRKSIAYIFKGFNGNLFLKFTTIVNKIKFNTKGKREPNKIILDIKTMLGKWYDKDVVINKQLKGTTPKEFFKILFSLSDNEVYYVDGVDENSFPKINNLHTKEYQKISELLKAYCANGIRFCFDRLERVKIFGDFKVDNINSDRILEYDITDSMMSEDDQLIYNTINTQSYQRQTLYNFDDLDRKYVKFYKVKRNATESNKLITLAENGDYYFNSVEITDKDFRDSVQLTDYVLFKRTQEPLLEVYGRVIDITDNSVVVAPIIYDKDRKLFNVGKGEYLYDILVVRNCPMDLYFVKYELPMVWKLSRNIGNDVKDSDLMKPILPKVNGETKYVEEISGKFGSASNAKVGKFTDIVEEIDKIYGTWDSSKLLYNRELDQFSNTTYPPIFLLSNSVEEKLIGTNPIQNFTTFDNSNILLEINRPTNNESDFTMKIQNTKNVNSDIDLFIDKEIGRTGNKVLQVSSLTPYKIGDVLIINKPTNLTPQEETEFDEVLSSIRWRITSKLSQRGADGVYRNYIFVDSPFAKRQKAGEVYEFTRFPNTSIVYIQELYFRGNPVLEFAQDVVGFSKDVNFEGGTSIELYGEKKYDLDSKQLDKENLKLLMGYILNNFSAVNQNTTKFNVPLSVFNALDLELLDIIRIEDSRYTQIKKSMQWVILELNLRSTTNEVQLKAINVNEANTKPYKIDIKDVISYNPVDIPMYDHAGGEGNDKPNDDGSGNTNEDKSLGIVKLAKVDSQVFRARVEKFENNFIYFKDFNGTEVEQYKGKLFPVSEFAVNIKGETIFVQSDMNYRAFIKKRRMYETEEVVIAPEDDVTFYVTTTFTDIDGTFYSRKMMVGDGDSYLSVDPIKGVKIVGDFVVGENNKNPNNDLWQSLQKNRTFQQPNQPMGDGSYVLREGDIWYDIDDENHAYRYNGTAWISARDNSIVSTKNTVFIQPNEPINTEGRPLRENDTWYDSDAGNKPYVYKGSKWVNVTDMALQEAITNVEKKAQESEKKLNDIASDAKITPDEKKDIKREFEEIKNEYPKLLSEAGKLNILVSEYKTSYAFLNDYLVGILASMASTTEVDRSDFLAKFTRYYNARQTLINNISSTIKSAADKAQSDATVALGNAKIFYQTEKPTSGMKENDLWYDTDDQNHPYVYKNGQWVSARDKIFETEGKNLVHFSDTKPLINDKSKEGDVWFDTGHNNNQYVLIKNNTGNLEWKLATDAGDKIQNGRIVINGNTTFNGDATIVSRGTDETTIIKGGNITFTRGGRPITVIRNMRMGEIETDSNGKGIISFPDFKNMTLLLSIKSFNISQNIRSLGCYSNLLNLSENKYQTFLYGTESSIGQGVGWSTGYKDMRQDYRQDSVLTISCSTLNVKQRTENFFYFTLTYRELEMGRVAALPEVNLKMYILTNTTTELVKNFNIKPRIQYVKQWDETIHDHDSTTTIKVYQYRLVWDGDYTINVSKVVDNLSTLAIKCEATVVSNRFIYNKRGEPLRLEVPVVLPISIQGHYNREQIQNLIGSGTLFYIAMEV